MSAMDIDMLIGGAAALLTTASNVPQLKKCWETRSAGDLSLKMLLALASGVALWIAYGGLKAGGLGHRRGQHCKPRASPRHSLLQIA